MFNPCSHGFNRCSYFIRFVGLQIIQNHHLTRTKTAWLVGAADHLKALLQQFLHKGQLTPAQVDALYALRRSGTVRSARSRRLSACHAHLTGCGASDPVTKLLLGIEVGARTLAMAHGVGPQVIRGRAPACLPQCLTDGYQYSRMARLMHSGSWAARPRQCAQGPVPTPGWTSRRPSARARTSAACRMPLAASPCLTPCPPRAWAQARRGDRGHQRWPREGLLRALPQRTGAPRTATSAPITVPWCVGQGRQTGLWDVSVD
jgi:hypothetical protein